MSYHNELKRSIVIMNRTTLVIWLLYAAGAETKRMQTSTHSHRHGTPLRRFERKGLRHAAALVAVLALTCYSGVARAQDIFTYDNGTANSFGGEPGGDLLALNHFNTGGSSALITQIGVLWNPISANVHPTVALYSDPNGDGNPSDMQPILVQPIYIPPNIVILNNTTVQYYSITPTVVDGSFFVGAFLSDGNNSSPAIGVDTSGSGPGQSWVVENTRAGQLSPQNPIATASDWENLNVFVNGNHVIHAVYSPVPEPPAASLLLWAGGVLLYIRKHMQFRLSTRCSAGIQRGV
jgi:hypothetical protein